MAMSFDDAVLATQKQKQFEQEHGSDFIDEPGSYGWRLYRSAARSSNPLGQWLDPPEDALQKAKLQMKYINARLPLSEQAFSKLRNDIVLDRTASMDHVERLKKLQEEVVKNRDDKTHLEEVLSILGNNKLREQREYYEQLEERLHREVVDAARAIQI